MDSFPELNFKGITGLALMGGGKLFRKVLLVAKDLGYALKAITSSRYIEQICDDELSLRDFFDRNKIPYIVVSDINASVFKNFLGADKEYLPISIGAPWIFKSSQLKDLFENKLLNLHGSLLPSDRGGGGFSWQIMRGNRLGSCVLHIIDGGIDTGPVIKFKEFIYPQAARLPKDFEDHYIRENLDFICEFLCEVSAPHHSFYLHRQLPFFSSYYPRLNTKLNSWIDWSWNSYQIERFVCAFDAPYSGAQTYWRDKSISLKSCHLQPSNGCHPYQAGLVIYNNSRWIRVAGTKADLLFESVTTPEGVSLLAKIREGDRLFTPSANLLSAKSIDQRVVYTPDGLNPPHEARRHPQ